MSRLAFTSALLCIQLAAQHLVLPDNHHLMERSDQLASTGDGTHWRTTAGRFQILYEASHFTGPVNGVTGPILITHLKFRGEDGEPNLGGQIYTGVTVEVGSTSLTAATLSSTFATNRLATTTTMGTLGTTNVTVAPSLGTCPNNDCIDIDLAAIGAAFLYDPTSASQPNLLIDISMPTAPSNAPPLYLIPIQDTTAHGAGIRGSEVSTSTVGAAIGTLDSTPAIVGIDFVGPGGHASIVPARNEEFGAACGGDCSTFYQTFNQGQPFDITGLTLTPDNVAAPNFYVVTGGAPPVDLTQLNATPNSVGDDDLTTQVLPFPWTYPGGSTTVIKASTNGAVLLDGAMTSALFVGNKAVLLGSAGNLTARYLPFWTDLHCGRNSSSNGLAGLHVRVDTSGGAGNHVIYTTWNDVGLFRVGSAANQPGHVSYTLQLVMYEATGIVEYRYGAMNPFASALGTSAASHHYSAFVGFTRGRIGGTTPSRDPQSRDLSTELPFATSVEGSNGNAGITAVATPIAGGIGYLGRLFGGQSVTWNIVNIPPTTTIALLNLDLIGAAPGIQVPGITAPGCMISTSPSPVALGHQIFVTPGSSATGTTPLVIPFGFDGLQIVAQAIGISFGGGTPLVPWASNAIRHTIGLD